METAGRLFAILGLAFLSGGMLFFAAVMAPLVFTTLPPNIAGPFIKTAFPFYYVYMLGTSALGVIGLILLRLNVSALILTGVLLITVWLGIWFLPHLNALQAAGNMAGFERGHTLSVWIDGLQFLIAVGLLIRLAI